MDRLARTVPVKVFALALLFVSRVAGADTLSLGMFAGLPGEGSGAPIGGRNVPLGIVAHYGFDDQHAITAGLGVPIAGAGASAWAGFELRVRPLRAFARLAFYAAPGVRAGFVGPGYYARHSNVFVGMGYIYSGPWTVGPRLPVGVDVCVGRFDLFIEGIAELPLIPQPELLAGAALGVRFRL